MEQVTMVNKNVEILTKYQFIASYSKKVFENSWIFLATNNKQLFKL